MKKDTKKPIIKTAKEAIVKTTKNVARNPISTAYFVAGVLGIYGIYKLYKFINPTINDKVKNVGNGSTIKATITNQQAINFSQQLLDAMNQNRNSLFFGGTDNATISLVFDRIKNGDDFTLVFKAFGEKEYNGYNSPVQGLEFLQSFQKRNLVYWLKSEISPFWDSKLYNKIKPVIKAAGFAF